MSKKILTFVIIIVAVLFFVGGYIASSLKIPAVSQASFKAGWEAAKLRLTDSALPELNKENKEIDSLSGEIQEINGDKITLKIRPLVPLADESLDTRIIIIDSATKIYSLKMGDSQEYRAEMKEFNKKMLAGSPEPITPPEMFKKSEISLADLKVGQMISVTAGTDIKEIKEFTALEISYRQSEISEIPTILEIPAAAEESAIPSVQ
jgi:hypothetical protein